MAITRDLQIYLESPNAMKQVLVKLRRSSSARQNTLKHKLGKIRRPSSEREDDDLVRKSILATLERESARDRRIRYNMLSSGTQIALIAPTRVIQKLAKLSAVEEIVPDEPTEAFDDEDF
jgi:hypothetical protein